MRGFYTDVAATAIVISLFFGVLPCLSDELPTSHESDYHRFDDVVVTSDRAMRRTATVPAAVTVIDREKIMATHARNVPDLLRYVAGVQVSDQLGNGRKSSVDIRGFGETAAANTLVLVDGRRINGADLSGVDWTTIPLERIEKIEVIRGGSAVLYGDNAGAGVINIITVRGTAAFSAAATLDIGEFNSYRPALNVSGSTADGRLAYAANGSYVDTDGYAANNGFRNRTGAVSLKFHGDRGFEVDLSSGIKSDRYGLRGSIPPDLNPRHTTDPDNVAETDDAYLRIIPALQLNEVTRVSLAIGGRRSEQQSAFFNLPGTFLSRSDVEELTLSPQLDHQFDLGTVGNRLVHGFDYFKSTIKNDSSFSGFVSVAENSRRSLGAFVNHTVAVVEDVTLDLGYRREWIRYTIENSPSFDVDTDAGRIGLNWNYTRANHVFIAYDLTFRTQLLDELGGSGFDLPLEPQRGRHLHGGIRHNFANGPNVGLALFQIVTTDEILFDPNFVDPNSPFPFPGQNVNYDETRRRGIEIEFDYQVNPALRVFMNYTLTQPILTSGTYQGNHIPGVAENTGSFGGGYSPWPELACDFRARWTQNRTIPGDWENTAGWDEDYLIADARVTWSRAGFSIYAGLNNVFDEAYTEIGGFNSFTGVEIFPAPGRHFVAGIRYVSTF